MNASSRNGSLSPRSDALTRADFDNYLFSAGKTAKAIVALQTAFIAYSNGKLDEANSLMFDAHSAVIEGEVFARKFFEAIVKRAVKDMPDVAEE